MEKTNRPYWEQVYSILETVDVATGERTVRKRFDSLIEAPNWLPDGNTLLYNAGGSLWLFDLASGESRKVDTRLRRPLQQRPRALPRRAAGGPQQRRARRAAPWCMWPPSPAGSPGW